MLICENLRFKKNWLTQKLKSYGKEKHLGDYYPDIDYDSDRYRNDLGRDLWYLMKNDEWRMKNFHAGDSSFLAIH